VRLELPTALSSIAWRVSSSEMRPICSGAITTPWTPVMGTNQSHQV